MDHDPESMEMGEDALQDEPAYDFSDAVPPTAYNYDPDSGEYLGEEHCQLDPLESQAQGRPVWLMPACAVTEKPGLEPRKGYAIVWGKSGVWEYAEDHRQTEYWPAGAAWNDAPETMKNLGPLPDGASLTRPEKPQEVLKQEERQALQARLDKVDAKSTRSLRAMLVGTATEEDKAILAALESEAASLRAQIAASGV